LLNRMDQKIAVFLKDKSIELYNYAHEKLFQDKIVLADSKFEFGVTGVELLLIDEVLTPDSSRFWSWESYAVGKTPLSFDKQFMRDYVSGTGWDKTPPAPHLPEEIISRTREKYIQIYQIITGDYDRKW
jgi:phosphoribosylaminoimidazole-succinocarboxamide synthase